MDVFRKHIFIWGILIFSALLHAAFIVVTPYTHQEKITEVPDQFTIRATLKLRSPEPDNLIVNDLAEVVQAKPVEPQPVKPEPVKVKPEKKKKLPQKKVVKQKVKKAPAPDPIQKEAKPIEEVVKKVEETPLIQEDVSDQEIIDQEVLEKEALALEELNRKRLEEERLKKEQAIQLAAAHEAAAAQALMEQRARIQASYVALLKERISDNKRYPRIAEKRRLEGAVELHFEIDKQGVASALDIQTGHRLFQQSAKVAVLNALPFPPPEGIEVPIKVDLTLTYRIK